MSSLDFTAALGGPSSASGVRIIALALKTDSLHARCRSVRKQGSFAARQSRRCRCLDYVRRSHPITVSCFATTRRPFSNDVRGLHPRTSLARSIDIIDIGTSIGRD
jgi:hypothetical protein